MTAILDPKNTYPAATGHADAAGSAATYRDFFFHWTPKLVRYLETMIPDGSIYAEDVAQEAMLAARVRWDLPPEPLRDFERPQAWLFKVAARRLRRELTRDGRLARGRDVADVAPAIRPVDRHITKLTVEDAIGQLPLRQAQAVTLYHLIELDIAAVAEVMGVKTGGVKRYLHDGRRHLAMLLGEEG